MFCSLIPDFWEIWLNIVCEDLWFEASVLLSILPSSLASSAVLSRHSSFSSVIVKVCPVGFLLVAILGGKREVLGCHVEDGLQWVSAVSKKTGGWWRHHTASSSSRRLPFLCFLTVWGGFGIGGQTAQSDEWFLGWQCGRDRWKQDCSGPSWVLDNTRV